jgi:hypothetical protein
MRKIAGTTTPRPPRKATPRSRSKKSGSEGPKAEAKGRAKSDAKRSAIRDELQIAIVARAITYLRAHNSELGIATTWLNDLDGAPDLGRNGAHLRWLLPVSTPMGGRGAIVDPRASFAYPRRGASTGQLLVVLLASLVWRDAQAGVEQVMWGGQGIRVVIRLVRRAGRDLPQIFTMAASSSLPKVPGGDVTKWNEALSSTDAIQLLDRASWGRWVREAGLDPAIYSVNQVGLCLDDVADNSKPPMTRLVTRLVPRKFADGSVVPGWNPDAPAYAFEGVVRSASGNVPRLEATRRYSLFAQLNKKVFVFDPPTRYGYECLFPNRSPGTHSGRPSRSWLELDPDRVGHNFGALKELADPNGLFFVAQSRHVEAGAPGFDENKPVQLNAGTADSIRTDGGAALNAFVRAGEFFWRLDTLYGLPLDVHFKFVNRPVIVRYRAGIIPGAGDGRTINAQVRWAPTMPPTSFPSNLEVRLALADLQSNEGRVRAINRSGRVNRSPLSIAVANRWCWHEFGHVLIAGATGELELDFAHSVGDALGAILCDPHSKLADQQKWRGVTFPFQSLPNRRHDHKARDGWSWSGTHYRPNRYFAGVDGHHVLSRGGYCSEQIMSSTLFHLYRSLGGDAPRTGGGPYGGFRTRSAEHTVALIMAGIGIFGPATAAVVRTADDFANSMMVSDSTMEPLTISGGTRYGGMANKVIRWAFEHQGAFAGLATPTWDHNAPGLPPDVDIFITGLRKGEAGGYHPVTFADKRHHADPNSLWVRRLPSGSADQDPAGGGDNYIFVKANNRGQATGAATMARVWYAMLPASGRIPPWTDPAWVALQPHVPNADGPNDVPSKTNGVKFGPFRWPGVVSGARYAILAEVSCEADPSNLDPGIALPCATSRCNVEELVAFDNNLALRIVKAV